MKHARHLLHHGRMQKRRVLLFLVWMLCRPATPLSAARFAGALARPERCRTLLRSRPARRNHQRCDGQQQRKPESA